jgi:hypothetical protein
VLFAGLQTWATQTSAATAGVHKDRLDGLVGSGAPFCSWALQTPAPPSLALHHMVDPHSPAVSHEVPHAPLVVSHTGPE